MKRPNAEEYQIFKTNLSEYSDLERRFNKYELAWLSKPPGSYYPDIVHDFFANYLTILEKDCPKRTRVIDIRNRTRVSIRDIIVDIFDHTINQILFGQQYTILIMYSEQRVDCKIVPKF